jgi:uncharacterized protein (TIGR03086 family)
MKNTGTLSIAMPSDREIQMTRVFDAPRHLVFEALTRPELLRRWFGPRGWSLSVCEDDFRVGGIWRFVVRGPDGSEMGMRGVHKEIVPPARLVHTELFDDFAQAGESVVTTVLTEAAGKTTMTVTVLYPSQEVRDAVAQSGMEHGAAESYDKLAEAIAEDGSHEAIVGRYRARADVFERKIVAVQPGQWDNQSPCEEWKARDVVGHIVMMHGVMLRPLGRTLSPAPAVEDDPLGAFRSARADVQGILDDTALAGTEHDWYTGRMTVAQTIDQVVSSDLVFHGWDLARATGQDAAMDPIEVVRLWGAGPTYDMSSLRVPGILGPEVQVPEDAPLQDRLLGLLGRNPA